MICPGVLIGGIGMGYSAVAIPDIIREADAHLTASNSSEDTSNTTPLIPSILATSEELSWFGMVHIKIEKKTDKYDLYQHCGAGTGARAAWSCHFLPGAGAEVGSGTSDVRSWSQSHSKSGGSAACLVLVHTVYIYAIYKLLSVGFSLTTKENYMYNYCLVIHNRKDYYQHINNKYVHNLKVRQNNIVFSQQLQY